ncbi:Uncharacterized protein HZ326_14126 [Fusarium oxysporum f. sp. albedinis]|nr:Uncharacterized protein HZ326_14126 [Fusarium oxysporum f. sp. albedinis]
MLPLFSRAYFLSHFIGWPINSVLTTPDDDEAIALEEYTDHNSYSLGKIHDHNIVIACLPARNHGSCSVATIAKDLQRTFKSICFGLLVGIGSGAPSPQHDIRLGDVVISQPPGTLGGVVQKSCRKEDFNVQASSTLLLNSS